LTHATHHIAVVSAAMAVLVMTVAACAQVAASPNPSVSASPSTAPTATPSAAPAVSATPIASALASSASACAEMPLKTTLPSDRLVNFTTTPGATSDMLTFSFGNPSLPGPSEPPQGSLDAARPPYTLAGSGATVAMIGDHVIAIRFTGMSLQNDAGEETYLGPHGIEEPFPALRHAVIYDQSEGVIAWYVGFDGPGCVTMARNGKDVIVTLAHS
jgi:hypothetical protein